MQRIKYEGLLYKNMIEKIKPMEEKEEYKLEDKDFLLIKAIQDLTVAIKMLRFKKW